jgi:hypothetical protein
MACLAEGDLAEGDGSHRLEEAFTGVAWDALVGQQVEILVSRLDEGKPHRFSAFDAGHLNSGLKACACRRRPEWSQHVVPILPKGAGVCREATQRNRLKQPNRINYV